MRLRALACALGLLVAACGDDDGEAPAATGSSSSTTPTTPAPTATTTPTTAAPDDALGGFVPAPLAWDGCGGGTECATLTVPLDYGEPGGPTIDLLVARVPAGDPGARIGALVTNPGGPGASAVEFAFDGGPFAGTELAERFDVVSFDPRGLGGSAPLACGGGTVDAFLAVDSDPDDDAEQAALDAAAQALAEDCGTRDAALLPHLGTDDVARDLEALRRAMGVPLAYYGFSYGTFLGLRYAELFPGGAAAIVLDGVVDPNHSLPDLLRSQAAAFDRVLPEALGDRLDDWDRLAAAVESAPVDGLGPTQLTTATAIAGYSESFWPLLRDGVDDALDGDGSTLLRLWRTYLGLTDFTTYQAVSCLDSEHPVGGPAWRAFAAELEAISPRFGAALANEMLPCAFWPTPPVPVDGPVRADGAPPILVIGTTGDPATPVEQAERVAAGLADGHLLLFDGEGHGAYDQSRCVRDTVARYIVAGELPAAGARC